MRENNGMTPPSHMTNNELTVELMQHSTEGGSVIRANEVKQEMISRARARLRAGKSKLLPQLAEKI